MMLSEKKGELVKIIKMWKHFICVRCDMSEVCYLTNTEDTKK